MLFVVCSRARPVSFADRAREGELSSLLRQMSWHEERRKICERGRHRQTINYAFRELGSGKQNSTISSELFPFLKPPTITTRGMPQKHST